MAGLDSIKVYDSKDFPDYLPKLNLLYDDLFAGGKGFRSQLIKWVGEPLGLSSDELRLLAQTIEFIHNASLLHDDLIDRSQLRRSKPAAWTKYSAEYAVLAGDYLLARVMVNLSKYGNIELVQYTAEMISDLLEGEWIQDSLVGDFEVTVEQLDQVHFLKTASLFKWCFKAPFIAAKKTDPTILGFLEEMGKTLGLCFQRSDDLLDFNVRNKEGKAVLGDLKSGYFNSFSSFLTSHLSAEGRQAYAQCQSLEDLKSFIGPDIFESRLKKFDEMNQEHVDLYIHYLDELVKLDSKLSGDFQKNLAPLGELLYWRKQRS
jgi:octaprenyl-diphosphate synthase